MVIATVKTFITFTVEVSLVVMDTIIVMVVFMGLWAEVVVEVGLVVMDTIIATVVLMELRVEVGAIATVKTFIMYIVEVSTVEFLCQEAIAPMLHLSFLLFLLLEIQ